MRSFPFLLIFFIAALSSIASADTIDITLHDYVGLIPWTVNDVDGFGSLSASPSPVISNEITTNTWDCGLPEPCSSMENSIQYGPGGIVTFTSSDGVTYYGTTLSASFFYSHESLNGFEAGASQADFGSQFFDSLGGHYVGSGHVQTWWRSYAGAGGGGTAWLKLTPTPEPGTLLYAAMGFLGLGRGLLRRRLK